VSQDNKTEQATPRRRLRAREQGQVTRSRELIASLSSMAAILALAWQLPSFAGQWRQLLRSAIEVATSTELRIDGPRLSWQSLSWLRGTAMALGLGWLMATAGALAQGGLVFAPSALAPKVSRMSPAAKMKQLFSLSGLSRMLKSLLPAAAVLYFAGAVLVRDWGSVLMLPNRGIHGLMQFMLGHVFEITWKSTLVLLLWSGVDYLFEHRRLEAELRMSRQELLDEFKETEGNPSVKARIRRLQRQVRRRRMIEDAKRAAVVITNPNEFAVALEFQPEMSAPVVVAKGRNLLAAQIKQVARWHGIPLFENPPPAHALYRAVEIGHSIPPKLYTVVAEVLAAIYRAQSRAAAESSAAGKI